MNSLPAYLQRMLAEHQELNERLDKLTGFVDTAPFRALDPVEQSLLRMQQKAMAEYEKVLRTRIQRALPDVPEDVEVEGEHDAELTQEVTEVPKTEMSGQ